MVGYASRLRALKAGVCAQAERRGEGGTEAGWGRELVGTAGKRV